MDNQPSNQDNKNGQDIGTHIDVISRPSLASSGPPSNSSSSDLLSSNSVNEPDTISDDLISSLDKPVPTGPALGSSSSNPTAAAKPPAKPIISGNGGKGSSNKMLSVILAVVILIIFVGGMYGVYKWQNNKVKSDDSSISLLQTQVTTLTGQLYNKKTTTITTTPTTPSSSSTTTSSPNTFTIKELGVEFTPTPILADLTYAANSAGTTANISTQTLTDLDSGCTANATTGTALGDLTKGTGQFTAKSGVTLVKQFTNSYISYTAPTAACSKDTAVTSLVNTLETDFKSIFSTIQQTSTT